MKEKSQQNISLGPFMVNVNEYALSILLLYLTVFIVL